MEKINIEKIESESEKIFKQIDINRRLTVDEIFARLEQEELETRRLEHEKRQRLIEQIIQYTKSF